MPCYIKWVKKQEKNNFYSVIKNKKNFRRNILFIYQSKWLLQCELNRNTITITIIKEIAFVHVCVILVIFFRQMQMLFVFTVHFVFTVKDGGIWILDVVVVVGLWLYV